MKIPGPVLKVSVVMSSSGTYGLHSIPIYFDSKSLYKGTVADKHCEYLVVSQERGSAWVRPRVSFPGRFQL